MFLRNGSLMVCGGYDNTYEKAVSKKCFQLNKGKWMDHSTLKHKRVGAQVVSTEQGTFLFGGSMSSKTYEFLPNYPGAKRWNAGKKRKIPGGFKNGVPA